MKWEINILSNLLLHKYVFCPRTYHLPSTYVLTFSSSLQQLCILEYLELGTLFLDAVKNLLELSLASIRIQKKTRNNVNSRILPFFNFYQPAKHNRRYLFAARCTAHFNFIVELIAILLQLFSDNCKTSAVFMINAAKYFFTKLFSNFQQGINIQENVKLKVKQSTTNNVMTSCTDHKLQRLPWAANTQRNNRTIR